MSEGTGMWVDDVIHKVEKRLAEIGVPKGGIYTRLYRVLDRLVLLPEDGTDTADQVGRINAICDAAGVAPGDVVERVEALAGGRRSETVQLALRVLRNHQHDISVPSNVRLAMSVLREAIE